MLNRIHQARSNIFISGLTNCSTFYVFLLKTLCLHNRKDSIYLVENSDKVHERKLLKVEHLLNNACICL